LSPQCILHIRVIHLHYLVVSTTLLLFILLENVLLSGSSLPISA
jgi:hypothetical protein